MSKPIVIGVAGLCAGLAAGYFAALALKPSGGATPAVTTTTTATADGPDAWLEECFVKPGSADTDRVVFTLGGKSWLFSELSADVQTALVALEEASYRQQRELTEDIAMRIMAAEAQGIKGDTLPVLETIFAERLKVTDDEVKKYYESNKGIFTSSLSLAQISETVRGYIVTLRLQDIKRELQAELAKKGDFTAQTRPPCTPQIALNTEGLPRLGAGPEEKSILFVTSFFCAECRELMPRYLRWISERQDQVRTSIMIAQRAGDTAGGVMNKALFCVNEQGPARLPLFLELAHKIPIQHRGDAAMISAALRDDVAGKLQLDRELYANCMTSAGASEFVSKAGQITASLRAENAPILYVKKRRLILSLKDSSGQVQLQKLIQMM